MEVNHELFHLSSTYVGHNVVYSGFSQFYDKHYLGFAISEAYTCILDLRYFGSKEKEKYYEGVYYITRPLVKMLEELVGQDKMEKLYSECDLPGLIEELSKYYGKKEAMHFINDMDKLSCYTENGFCFFGYPSVVYYRSALIYLGRCLIKKNAQEYYLSDLDVLEYFKRLEKIEESMKNRLICQIPFKIVKSRKYGEKDFEKDVEKIENALIKKYT